RLRCAGPAADRLLYGLCAAASRRRPVVQSRIPPGSGHDQCFGREGVRRGRLRRGAAVGHERAGRRALGIRHSPHRYAGNPGAGVAGDRGSPRQKRCSPMKLAITLRVSQGSGIDMETVWEAERLGYEAVWCGEAYGTDAVSPVAWVLAQTKK